jgi:hypothetical protein
MVCTSSRSTRIDINGVMNGLEASGITYMIGENNFFSESNDYLKDDNTANPHNINLTIIDNDYGPKAMINDSYTKGFTMTCNFFGDNANDYPLRNNLICPKTPMADPDILIGIPIDERDNDQNKQTGIHLTSFYKHKPWIEHQEANQHYQGTKIQPPQARYSNKD